MPTQWRSTLLAVQLWPLLLPTLKLIGFFKLRDLDSDTLASSPADEGMLTLMFLAMGGVKIAKVTMG